MENCGECSGQQAKQVQRPCGGIELGTNKERGASAAGVRWAREKG